MDDTIVASSFGRRLALFVVVVVLFDLGRKKNFREGRTMGHVLCICGRRGCRALHKPSFPLALHSDEGDIGIGRSLSARPLGVDLAPKF
mgnify:CR=1 FL=1